ncbi:monocarboxylate transporter 14-like isoform X2 [Homarus americanus]|nr:monocarboxylate transporter 14-like isoform X2 [Homarus americanus]XP_042223505.1 monocarboxylate transporter 14-like isoform X2 [Homarus americanus]XP_042223506.1 monocarboxylate transporter 14-like isoform X2 [Homarus americanus]
MVTLCFSILFSGFLIEQGASSTTIAWIFNLHIFLWNLIGPLTGPLSTEFGFRRVSLVGTAVSSLSLLLVAFTDSIAYLMVFFSLCGLFGGLGCKPAYVLTSLYFEKRRGQAFAMLMGGICIGQFMGPPLVRYLLENYALMGANLILGALVLNSCVGAALFHPVEWHMKRRRRAENPITPDCVDEDKEDGCMIKGVSCKDKEMMLKSQESKWTPGEAARITLIRNLSRCSSVSSAASFIDLTSVPPVSHTGIDVYLGEGDEDSSYPKTSRVRKIVFVVVRVVRLLITDLKIFKSPRALIIAIAGVCVANGYLNFHMILPFAIQNSGYTLEEAAWCMSIAAISNLVARLSNSALSDCSWYNMRLVYMLGAGLVALTTLVFSFLSDLTWMKVTMGLWGYGVGTNISLYTLIMPKYMGRENMAAIFGGQSFFMAIGHITLGPLIGLIRDLSGSYAVAMQVISVEVFLCVLLWFFMPAAVTYDKKKENLQKSSTDAGKTSP